MSSSVTNTKAFLENKDAANFRNLKKKLCVVKFYFVYYLSIWINQNCILLAIFVRQGHFSMANVASISVSHWRIQTFHALHTWSPFKIGFEQVIWAFQVYVSQKPVFKVMPMIELQRIRKETIYSFTQKLWCNSGDTTFISHLCIFAYFYHINCANYKA